MLRYWNLLKYASNEGYEIFDFGRSTCDEGNYNFKKQWGANPATLQWTHLETDGEIIQDTLGKSRQRSNLEKVQHHILIIVINSFGSKARKYILL